MGGEEIVFLFLGRFIEIGEWLGVSFVFTLSSLCLRCSFEMVLVEKISFSVFNYAGLV